MAHAARRAGSRLLLNLVPLSPAVTVPTAMDEPRTQPVRLGTATAERDSVRFLLPEGYAADNLPEPVELESPVGRYRLTASPDGDALVVVRELVVDAPNQPAEAYDAIRDFFQSIAEADGARAVVRRE